jgi:metallo-beta-lactamase family protein
MGIRLHFWGAAQTVTGSSHHLECAGRNILPDCGLFRQAAGGAGDQHASGDGVNAVERSERRADLGGAVAAHIDHSGNLPGLIHQGYRGPIYDTDDDRPVRSDAEGQRAYPEGDADFIIAGAVEGR